MSRGAEIGGAPRAGGRRGRGGGGGGGGGGAQQPQTPIGLTLHPHPILRVETLHALNVGDPQAVGGVTLRGATARMGRHKAGRAGGVSVMSVLAAASVHTSSSGGELRA